MYLFGYGSLINLNSAQKSFKRILSQNDLIPVKIKGYKRVWNAIESIQFENENNSVNGIFLNIQKDENSFIYGTVIKISNEELEYLKLREKNYSCIQIDAKDVMDKKFDENLIAFMTTKEEKLAKIDDGKSFIPKRYIKVLEEGLKSYDSDFVTNFETILKDYSFEIKEGIYNFTDPIQNSASGRGIKK